MNKILISPFTMGPIAKGQELIIDGEYPFGYNFKGIAGLWDKELFNLPIEAVQYSDGSHTYLIPKTLYDSHASWLLNFDEENYDDCTKFDNLFGKYMGIDKIYINV